MKQHDYILSTDSGCDISIDMCNKYDIRPLMMEYTDGNANYFDTMKDEDAREFYKKMRAGTIFKTTAVNINAAYNYFKELLKENKPIIHVTLGSGISSTYNNCLTAVKLLEEEGLKPNITVIDSTAASLCYGMYMVEAAKKRDEGMNYEELVDWFIAIRHKGNTYYTTSTLTYLARGGRVTKIASVFGNILSIRPILKLDYEGHLLVCDKGHGKNNTKNKVMQNIGKTVVDAEKQILYISHSDCLDDAKEYGDMLQKQFGFKEVVYTYIGSIIGSHTGPGLVAIFYFGIDRTN